MKNRVISIGMLICLSLGYGQTLAQDGDTLKRAELYEPLIIASGKSNRVDPRLLWTVAFLETRFRPEQVSQTGARGMMQFMPSTARRFGLEDPHKPAPAIEAAARYLASLQSRFGRRLDLILAAYNSGEQTVEAFRDGRKLILSNGKVINPNCLKTGGVPPYRETYMYVRNGISVYSMVAKRRELQIPGVAQLEMPGKLNRKEPAEALPPEITQLKQGSIYVRESTVAADKSPTLISPSPAQSIYP